MHSLLLQSVLPLLLITYFLSINVELSLSQDDLPYANCSEAINCGGIGGISYPFWGVNRANYCGLPGFEVKCVDNAPMMNMSNINYRILKTNSSAPSVTVARQDYWETLCPPNYNNTNINFSLFNYTSGITNLTFYYGCNTSTSTAIPGLKSSSRACNGDTNVTYVTRSPPVDPVTARICASGVIVPVFVTAAEAVEAKSTTIQEAVDGGLELRLQIDNVQCNNCSESGGKCGLNTTSGGFSCFCQDQAYATTCNAKGKKKELAKGKKKELAKGLALRGIGVTVIFLYIYILWKQNYISFVKKDKGGEFDVEAFIRNCGLLTPKRYTYENVKKITDSFRDKIGKGGYGTVYKGRLPDGLLVAVKVLSVSKGNGGEDFINEVASIGRTSHVNIVTLFGFCYEGDKQALIYEYMPNGSLDNFIHKYGSGMENFRLEWKILSEIAVGITRGLEYLHRGCNTRILHFDIKPQNILLDKDFHPKISDFGLAKLCKTKDSIVSMMGTRGTAGYIAPEVFVRKKCKCLIL